MLSSTPTIWTIGRIALHFGVERHRIEYIVKSRRIKAAHWVGNARVFNDDSVHFIGDVLNQQDDQGGNA